jgi:hypothetical protein
MQIIETIKMRYLNTKAKMIQDTYRTWKQNHPTKFGNDNVSKTSKTSVDLDERSTRTSNDLSEINLSDVKVSKSLLCKFVMNSYSIHK